MVRSRVERGSRVRLLALGQGRGRVGLGVSPA